MAESDREGLFAHRPHRIADGRGNGRWASPLYANCTLSLDGRAEEIYLRAGETKWAMIDLIVREQPRPIPQEAEVTHFRRRQPELSLLPSSGDLRRVYDHIRMLDAPTYPLASLHHGNFLIEFSHVQLGDAEVKACVLIREMKSEN